MEGCRSDITRTLIDASSIPDQTYDVTVYRGRSFRSYAVLFDIPDDGTEVFMKYTSVTQKIGMDSPRKYIDELNSKIRFYRTTRIGDQHGTVRGYLLVSNALDYRIRYVGERIEVTVGGFYGNTGR